MVSDWEYHYNGLTFGGAQPFGVTKVTGFNPPNARADVMEKAVDDGAFVYAQFVEQRVIVIDGDLATTAMETDLDSLRRAFAPRDVDLALTYKRPGAGERRVECIPTRVHFDIDAEFDIGYLVWTVELIAGDPRIYDETASSHSASLAPATAGVQFDMSFDLSFGGGGVTTVVAYNAGTVPTHAVISITGPATTIRLRNLTTGKELFVDTDVPAGSTLRIDFDDRLIMLDDTASRYGDLVEGSEWWTIEPGNNTISMYASSTTGASSAVIDWRSAWF